MHTACSRKPIYAVSRTIASEPITLGPLAAMTGQSRQNTPTGDRYRIISITFIKMSFHRLIPSTAFSAFSPKRIMAKPINSAMTMTCSMTPSVIGVRKFDGKTLTSTSMGGTESGAL